MRLTLALLLCVVSFDLSAVTIGGDPLTLTVTTDNYPSETTWSVTSETGATVMSGGPYGSAGETYTESFCLPDGCYILTVNDSYGDGICCAYGDGSFELTLGSQTLASGGVFDTSTSASFCLSEALISTGCTDPTAVNFNPDATSDDGSCVFIVPGCTDPEANNFEPSATLDNNSCTYEPENCDFSISLLDTLSGSQVGETTVLSASGTLNSIDVIFGFEPIVENGQWPADLQLIIGLPDGSCANFGGFVNSNGCSPFYDFSVWGTGAQNSGEQTFEVSLNFSWPSQNNGNWTFTLINGRSSAEAVEYDLILGLNGLCSLENNDVILPCDGSIFECFGCTNQDATNFDVVASIDDGSCLYNQNTLDESILEAQDCPPPMDSNLDGTIGIDDMLVLLSGFGDTDMDYDGVWDSADDCVGDYDVCGICNGPGPQLVVVDSISISTDSIYIDAINDWLVFEVPDTTFALVCEPCGDPVSYNGYDYATVYIGNKCWFAENLKTESYENGEAIPTNLNTSDWLNANTGAISTYGEEVGIECVSTFQPNACDTAWSFAAYGRLYNWHAVNDPRNLCPSGWHVSTDEDWNSVEINAGMSPDDALSIGERGTHAINLKSSYGWNNYNGNNQLGFSVVPGGSRISYGAGDSGTSPSFGYAGDQGSFWTSSQSNGSPIARQFSGLDGVVRRTDPTTDGMSVRCVRD